MAASKISYYPLFLNIKGKRCLVVGGGTVALRKVKNLLKAGARVTVVAPELKTGLRASKKLTVHKRSFRRSDLAGSLARRPRLVVAATSDRAVNRSVAAVCRAKGLWVNVITEPSQGDFVVPATVHWKGISAALSTAGRSPALTRFLKKKLENFVGPELEELADIFDHYREGLTTISLTQRRRLLGRVLSEASLRKVRRQGGGGVRGLLDDTLTKKK